FPQMRPEKKKEVSSEQDFITIGVPQPWVAALYKLNINTLELLKEANPNKLLNDLGGMRKKLKMDVPAVQLQEIQNWIANIK
ncbi:MAG TPA: lysine--tRNA ligase, partial [Bacteroidales bacterium]|nr:lysine--tRNA ligase [Bacteroidales bacterium]